jgi:cold shock CspA family protein
MNNAPIDRRPQVPERRYRKSEQTVSRRGLTGTIARWKADRGFGFIRHPEFKDDLFVHVSAIAGYPASKSLIVDQKVSFDVVETEKGPAAVNVRPQL